MKKILLICLLLIGAKAFAQDAPLEFQPPLQDGKVVYQKVVEVPGKSQSDIYSTAVDWFLKAFHGVDHEVITNEMNHFEAIGTFNISEKGMFGMTTVYDVHFTLALDIKDGKYQYTVSNIRHTPQGITKSSENANVLYDIPEERDLGIAKGEIKGYSKGKKQAAMLRMANIEMEINQLLQDLQQTENKRG